MKRTQATWRDWRSIAPWAVALATAACSPTLDWREVRPQGSHLVLQFPCRPEVHAREIPLAGGLARVSLYACRAGDQTWALSAADVASPTRVAAALLELRQDVVSHLRAAVRDSAELQVRGATPAKGSERLTLLGVRPDGRRAMARVALFSRGTWVFQATVLGARLSDPGAENFFESLGFE